MIHEKTPGQTGKIVVAFEVEDWIWLCKLLSTIVHEENSGLDRYSEEDTEYLLDTLMAVEVGEHVL